MSKQQVIVEQYARNRGNMRAKSTLPGSAPPKLNELVATCCQQVCRTRNRGRTVSTGGTWAGGIGSTYPGCMYKSFRVKRDENRPKPLDPICNILNACPENRAPPQSSRSAGSTGIGNMRAATAKTLNNTKRVRCHCSFTRFVPRSVSGLAG